MVVAQYCRANGRVASDLSAASAKPVRADIVNTAELPVKTNAWQRVNNNTFFLVSGDGFNDQL